jgi:hypothetical protein
MVLVSCAVVLVLTQFWGTSLVQAHPGAPAMTAAALEFDGADLAPAAIAVPHTVPVAFLAPPRATLSAWTWVALLVVPGIRAARRWGGRRSLALAIGLVLGVFTVEGAIHSIHHVKDPGQAERCPVYSASQQVTGLCAGSATPDLAPPTLADRCRALLGVQLVGGRCPSSSPVPLPARQPSPLARSPLTHRTA